MASGLLVAMAAVAIAPGVAAHDCTGLTPASCGNCLSGTHSHWVGTPGAKVLYCSSTPTDFLCPIGGTAVECAITDENSVEFEVAELEA